MTTNEFRVKTDEGAYDLEASVRLIGNDLLVAIWGGEKPHIGAVSVAQARPSLKDPNVTSATASVFCFVGHKEDELAKAASEILAAAMNTQVVVTAGIHWDNMSKEGIQKVIRNSEILVDLILEKVASSYP
jgi:predicted nucleotide-binding protein